MRARILLTTLALATSFTGRPAQVCRGDIAVLAGQAGILVTQDMLGIYTRFHPRFVRRYAELGKTMLDAFHRYVNDVRNREFPSKDESY